MSTRWYPIFMKGNPQLRVFLPNFYMKLLKPEIIGPSNIVNFECSMEMTNHDVRNYLEKIYKIPVVNIRIYIKQGKFRKNIKNYIVKDDDQKIAVVAMDPSEKFTFPVLFPKDKEDNDKDEREHIKETKKEFKNKMDNNLHHRKGCPSWFSM